MNKKKIIFSLRRPVPVANPSLSQGAGGGELSRCPPPGFAPAPRGGWFNVCELFHTLFLLLFHFFGSYPVPYLYMGRRWFLWVLFFLLRLFFFFVPSLGDSTCTLSVSSFFLFPFASLISWFFFFTFSASYFCFGIVSCFLSQFGR